ncbi:MAG TPA: hypothetical protein PLT65_05740 [Bacilli bacterium]|nr:hypothetical protein [Bacilli bacterium]
MSVEQIKYIFDNWGNLKWEEQNYNNFINYLKKMDLNTLDLELQQKVKNLLIKEEQKRTMIVPNNNVQVQEQEVNINQGTNINQQTPVYNQTNAVSSNNNVQVQEQEININQGTNINQQTPVYNQTNTVSSNNNLQSQTANTIQEISVSNPINNSSDVSVSNNEAKNKTSDKTILTVAIIIIIILSAVYLIYNSMNNGTKENNNNNTNNNSNNNNNNNNNSNSSDVSLIPLKQGKTEKITNAELVYINDYKLSIPSELIAIGYTISIDNDVLTITAKDNSYKFVMLQLTDNYIQIKEEDSDSFFDTDEYEKWEEKLDEVAFMSEEYDKLFDELELLKSVYYKNLGYTFKNTPDLDMNELNSIVGKYLLDGESSSSSSNGLFPGQEYYQYFTWGKRVRYAIPKYQNDSFFGEDTSDFSAYLETFHYYDPSTVRFEIDLWTL